MKPPALPGAVSLYDKVRELSGDASILILLLAHEMR